MAEAVKTQSLFSYYGASHDGKQLPVTPEEVFTAVRREILKPETVDSFSPSAVGDVCRARAHHHRAQLLIRWGLHALLRRGECAIHA